MLLKCMKTQKQAFGILYINLTVYEHLFISVLEATYVIQKIMILGVGWGVCF